MRPTRFARPRCALLLLGASALCSGCVFDDIHEELVAINQNMSRTQDLLRQANTTLDEVHQQLDQVQRTNDLLVQLQAGLGTEEIVETKTQNRLSLIGTMESIDRSLLKMDEHMSALRKTIANIDSTIPFLSFSAEPDTEDGASVEEGEIAVEEGGVIVEEGTIVVTPEPDATTEPESPDQPASK